MAEKQPAPRPSGAYLAARVRQREGREAAAREAERLRDAAETGGPGRPGLLPPAAGVAAEHAAAREQSA